MERRVQSSVLSHASSVGGNNIGASVKKRVMQFERHTALPKPSRALHEFTWDDIITSSSQMLGQGSFSCVHSIGLCSAPGKIYALKQLSLANPSPKQYKRGAIDIALEGKLLSYLDHDNIIRLYGIKKGDIQYSINDREDPFFLVLDYLTETLEDRLEFWRREESAITRLRAKMSGYDEKMMHRVEVAALGIARGMEYLHSLGVIFRDLKPENLGFDSQGTIKIFDFGVARDLHYVKKVGDKLGFTGTPRYMANEIGAGDDYGLPADVYSFGVLLHQICTLKQPYASLKSIDAFRAKVVQGGERPKLSLVKHAGLRNLIERCWDPCADKRPTFTQVRQELETIVAKCRRHTPVRYGKDLKTHSEERAGVNKLFDHPATTNVSSNSLFSRRSSIETDKCAFRSPFVS